MRMPTAMDDDTVDSYALRSDLHECLVQGQIDPSRLSTFQRIILTTDGTLTEILEAYLLENIHVVKLFEKLYTTPREIPHMGLAAGIEIIERKILLQGTITKNNWLYAESIIVPERLEPEFRHGLLHSRMPIGKLWLQHKVETFKEIIFSARETAGPVSEHFHIPPEEKLLCRTYRVLSNRKPVMMITEKFPESYFGALDPN